ncbi:MAG: efflux transporter outer membrane subunit [Massilia sp.]
MNIRAAQKLAMAAAMIVALTGCMPAYRQAPPLSQVNVPASWREANPGNAVIDAHWWRTFGDPTLSELVEAALKRNTDVLAAVARVDEARALAQVANAARMPALNAAVGAQSGRTLGSTGVAITHSVQPELQASWEVDLWGRLREQAQSAALQFQATQVERDGVALAVAAATAQSYVGLLALDEQLRITKATAASRAEALRLATDQARLGYTSQLQLTQAESEHETVLQAIPQLELAIQRQENALRLLVGETPGDVIRSRSFPALQVPPIASSLPSDLLSRRPDIVQRGLVLAASDANLASRRAAFLPQVALSAKLGSLFINGLDYDPISVWGLGGSILAPIFSAGRLTAQMDAAAAQRDQAAYAYRNAVLTAFSEVENALSGVSRLQAQMEHSKKRRDILARTLEFAHDRYQAGYASYLEELDAQRSLYQVELDAITLRQSQLNNLIALYRALGGGWAARTLQSESIHVRADRQ